MKSHSVLTKKEKRLIEKINEMSKEEREQYFNKLRIPKWFPALQKLQKHLERLIKYSENCSKKRDASLIIISSLEDIKNELKKINKKLDKQ